MLRKGNKYNRNHSNIFTHKLLVTDLTGICLKGSCINQKFSLAIEKRNDRERNRVKAINTAFQELRLTVPSISLRNKRISKVKILNKAIQYIKELEAQLQLWILKLIKSEHLFCKFLITEIILKKSKFAYKFLLF